jgi:diacylglycerol kinase family enzyme
MATTTTLEPSPATVQPDGPRRLCVVVNREGGTARGLGPDTLQARLATAFAEAGAEAAIELVPGSGMTAALERARDQVRAGRFDGVVVGGGDGSVNGAAKLLAGTGIPMGILPLGTLNHFARDLGMPADPEEAAAAIATAGPRAVDVAEVNGEVFVNNSLLGAYPYMVADRERRRREHGLGKWPAMALAFLRMLWRFPRRRLTLCLPDGHVPVRTPSLMVGVNEYDPRNFEIRRNNGLDGGELWLLVARHRHALGFAWFAFRLVFGGIDQARDFDVLHLTELEVRARPSRLPVATDGELLRLRPPLRYRIRPGELRVLAPPAVKE